MNELAGVSSGVVHGPSVPTVSVYGPPRGGRRAGYAQEGEEGSEGDHWVWC
jgi:methyl coenzyme M reductase subunit D